jgi:tetratricopeptide (TPR) repeat protein
MPAVDLREGAACCWLVALGVVVGSVGLLQVASAASPGQDALDMGVKLYRDGQFNAAVDAFREATQRDPGLLKAWENLGWAYRRLGKDNDAIRVWKTVLKIEPNTVSVLNELGRIHADRNDWDRARAWYERSLRQSPDQPVILFQLAEVERASGRPDEANHYYHEAELASRRALDSDALNAETWSTLGWIARRQGRTRDALSAWEKAVDLNPEAAQLYPHLADASIEVGDAASARAWYERAWLAGSRTPQIAYRSADLAFQAAEDDQALFWISRLFQVPGAESEWALRVANLFLQHDRAEQGLVLFDQRMQQTRYRAAIQQAVGRIHTIEASKAYQADRLDEAIAHYRRALEYDQMAVGALRDLGWAYWTAGRWAECLEVWTRYATAYPNRPDPLNLLTQLHLAQKAYPAAIQTIQASLALSPDQPRERLKLAKALLWDRQFEEAKRHAAVLASAYPDDLSTQVFWAEMLTKYRDFQAAEAQWRVVLAHSPPSAKGRYYYSWVRSLYNLGRYDAALRAARESIATDGAQIGLLRLLIEDALAREDMAEAVRWYELAVEQFPERPELWVELAALYRERGMIKASDATLRRAKRRHPDHRELLIDAADVHRLGKRYHKAVREYRALFARYPQNREVFIGLFNTLVETGRWPEALDLLEHSQTTFLTDYQLDIQKGRVLLAQGNTSSAEALFMRVASPDNRYIPILLYHGLGGHPRSATLPVSLFDSQLKALRDAGYTAITVKELAQMIDGRQRFPEQPIVITFDDARLDSFQLGDPVLAKYGMKATMFVPTARIVGRGPFFADWDLIRGYARSGRWDLQGHGHEAHDPIPIDGSGQTGGFLVNRQWLQADQRLETSQEYVARLEADYQETIRLLAENVSSVKVIGYAFPFSEAGQTSIGNEPDAATVNERLLFRYFRYGFVQDSAGYNEVSSTAPTTLRRFAVPRSWDGQKLLKHLATRHPHYVAQMQLGKSWAWRGQYEQSRSVFRSLEAQDPLLTGESAYQLAQVAFHQGQFREAQRQLQTAMLYGERSSDGQDLMRRIQWETRPRVTERLGTFHDSNGRTNWWDALELRYPLTEPVTISTEVGVIRFTEEGLSDLSGREVTAGAEWQTTDRLALRTSVRGRFIEQSENSLNVWLRGVYETDIHELRLQWASEDVDTVRAHEIGLQSRGYAASYLVRPAPEWDASVFGSQRYYDDGNARIDLRATVRRNLLSVPYWRLGLGITHKDTRMQSDRYYTPEDLTEGRGIVAYRRRWDSGWEFSGEAGLGWAREALNGDRLVSDAAVDTLQAWTERIQSRLGWSYSRSPGYQSWFLEGSVSLRF